MFLEIYHYYQNLLFIFRKLHYTGMDHWGKLFWNATLVVSGMFLF